MTRRLGLALVLACAVTTGPGCDEGASGTSPTLTLQCSANPASGPAPLTVAFVLNVAGAEGSALSVLINYGDGHQGTNPDDRHVYSSAGAYSASFTVASNTQTARCSAAVTVSGSTVPTPTPTSTPSPSPIPNPPGNQQPRASFKTTPDTGSTITGTAPFKVRFNMCQTVDPDRDSLYFKMDLDGDGGFEFHGSTGADCRHEVTYAAGTRTATLCVTDVVCPFWPVCDGYPLLHPFQCRSYTVTAIP
jgi:PKD repeat protein